MSGMRQGLALSVILLMYYAYENKKWILMLCFFSAAFFIHNSSIIALIGLLLASFVKPGRITGFIVLIGSVIFMGLSLSMKDVFSVIEGTNLMQLAFIEDYSAYADYLSNEFNLSFVGRINLVLPLVLMSTLILLNPTVLKTFYARIYLLGAILVTMFSAVPMISRYFMYFIISEVYLIPQIYTSKEMKYNKIFCRLLLFYQAVILFLYLYLNNAHGFDYNVRRVAPYFFFFQRGF